MNDNNQSASTLNSVASLAKASWDSTAGSRLRLTSFILLYVIAYSIDLLVPWAIGWILGVFVKEGLTEHAIQESLRWIMFYVALKMAYAAAHHFGRYYQGTTAYGARFKKLEEVFTALVSFPLKWHVTHHTGENLSKLHRSVGAIESVVSNYIWQIIDGIMKFFAASLLLFALDVEVAITVLVMGFITVMVMILFNARLTRNIRRNNRFYDRLNRTCVDYLSNIITVKTLHLEQPALNYLTSQRDEGFKLSRKIWKYQELKWGTIAVGYSLVMGTSLYVYFGNQRSLGTTFDVAQVYVLLNYLDRIFAAIGSFTGYYGGIIEAATAYDDASSVLRDSKLVSAPVISGNLTPNWSTLELSNVSFSYSSNVSNIRNLSFAFRRGEKIALVGPSGGGKSTLLKVLAGMLTPQEGSATVDSGATVSFDDIARISLLVPQEPEIFSETVQYNINFDQNFSQEQMQKAIEICRIDHILEKLTDGWDSHLEEAGLNISVGERQRLALARGILRVPGKDILLLDEPTSSLDPLTEKQIFAGILHEFRDLCVITACHRLALVPLFDTIVYVKDGRIEEVGSFPELRTAGRGFSAAWADYERTVVSRDGGIAA
ncbi:MAG: ABC transporter ATP-binding protein [Pseudomonadota bacterium]|jgi:ATP-binding cassette subfamily B protein